MKLQISYNGVSIFQKEKHQVFFTELKGFSGLHVSFFVNKVLGTTTLLI